MKSFAGVFIVTLSVLTMASLSSCAPAVPKIVPDKSAVVKLNYEDCTLTYPVSEYEVSPQDYALLSRANEAIMASCTIHDGFPVNPYIGSGISEERPHGMWDVQLARKYGFLMKYMTEDVAGQKRFDKMQSNPAWINSREKCGQDEEIKQRLAKIRPKSWTSKPDGSGPNLSVAEQIGFEASETARRTPEWKALVEQNRQCFRDHGLTPTPNGWGAKETAQMDSFSEESIRAAPIEAQCNQTTQLTQKLGNMEASYQAPLIRKNEAALVKEKEELDAKVAAAKAELAGQVK